MSTNSTNSFDPSSPPPAWREWHWDIVPLVLFFILSYYTLAPFLSTVKQRAWILTTMSSLLMTSASLPFLYHYLADYGSILSVHSNPPWATKVLRMFQAYLISDLLVGVVHYRPFVHPLSGWMHHSLYVWVVQVAIDHQWAHIFCLCAVMELPTAILALGTLSSRFRSDAWFGFTFFLTRICLHLCFIVAYAKEGNRTVLVEGSYIPSVVLACAFPLHAMWFKNYINGLVRRSKKKAVPAVPAKPASVVEVQAVNVPTEIPATSIVARRRRLSKLTASAPSLPSGLPESTSAPASFFIPPEAGTSTATPRAPPFVRRSSLDRAIAKIHAGITRAQQSRAAAYARERLPAFRGLPDRRTVLDYVGQLRPVPGSVSAFASGSAAYSPVEPTPRFTQSEINAERAGMSMSMSMEGRAIAVC